MRSFSLQTILSLGLISLSVACAATGASTGDPNGGTKTPTGKDEGSSTVPGEEDDVPHALGTITLGEARSSATGASSPVISASFMPDAKAKTSCTRKVGECQMAEVPKCQTGSVEGCKSGEICTFDDSCEASCVKACTKTCQAGEVCEIVSISASGDGTGMACKKKPRFDAGAIAFSGTTQAITLFPPYAVTPEGNGAPFMARSEIRVQASGATTGSGFDKFDEKFTSTTFLETNPPLSDLDKADVFGKGDVTIGWVPGEDHVIITATGPFGSAKCEAKDADGSYALSREVIDEVMGSSSSSSLSITVTRERREVRRDKKALGAPVEKGFLELVTTSSETQSFQACSTGYSMCNGECVDTRSDRYNCGTCGKVCASSQYCSSGYCY